MKLQEFSLNVKKSTLPNAGKGLFTRSFIPKGSIVTEYEGILQTWKEVEYDHDNDYIFFINNKAVVNAKPLVKTFGRYANDAEGFGKIDKLRNNARYKTVGKRVFIEAIKDIPAGSEVLVSYGKDYWKQAKINTEVEAEQQAEKKAASKTRKKKK